MRCLRLLGLARARPNLRTYEAYRAGTNVGPTARTGRLGLSGAAVSPSSDGAAACAPDAAAAAAFGSSVFTSARIGRPWASRGCDIFCATPGVATMSSLCTVGSLAWPSACAQLWPGWRQLHDGTSWVRYLNALGSDV